MFVGLGLGGLLLGFVGGEGGEVGGEGGHVDLPAAGGWRGGWFDVVFDWERLVGCGRRGGGCVASKPIAEKRIAGWRDGGVKGGCGGELTFVLGRHDGRFKERDLVKQ